MTDVNLTSNDKLSLRDAINICLSCVGETPVDAPDNTSTNVTLSKQIIEEVSRDVQSKGWWFNTSGANITVYFNSGSGASENFNSVIPEEARRYISIRAARVFQSRFVGSEELHKFSLQEEQVSFAILTQAHVRNNGNSTSFTAFPAELKAMGIEEIMFLQQSAEEKLLSLRLDTELKTAAKLEAETSLIADQGRFVDQQVATEAQNTIKMAAEAGLVTSQQALIAQQTLDLVADIALKTRQGEKIDEEADLLQTQDLLTAAQKDTELQNAIKVAAESGLITAQQALVSQQVLDAVADVNLKGKQGLLLDKQVLTEVQNALKVSADSGLITAQQALVSQQTLESVANVSNITADATLKGKQGALVDAQELKTGAETSLTAKQGLFVDKQTLTEVQNALKVAAETSLLSDQESLVVNQAATEMNRALDVAADTTIKGKQGLLIDKQALTEVENALKMAAETSLLADQEALVVKQALTEVARATDIAADTTLKGKQGALVDAQETKTGAESALIESQTTTDATQRTLIAAQEVKTDAEKIQVDAQTALLGSQKTELDAKTAVEVAAEKAFYDGVVDNTQNTYRDFAAEMRIMGVQELAFQSTPAYKKIELLRDAQKLRTSTATETGTDSKEIAEVNKVMRFIGEPPVTALNSNSLASECVRLMRDTDTELQGRGWWFNTEKEVKLTADSSGRIVVPTDALTVELAEYPTRIKNVSGVEYIYDLKEKSYTSWSGNTSATIIYKRGLPDVPQKYLEYLNVRVAILLTELYPQSGVDIQRLPKMEQELRTYFKDREFDDANYSIFDNYDVASGIGLNRNHSLI